MQGLFISLEGPDGSGKSTQARLWYRYFKKRKLPVLLTREPGGSPIAEDLRKVLLSEKNKGLAAQAELLLFEAGRSQHVADTIAPALKAGKIVLCDRFTDSTLAYQGYGRGLDHRDIRWLNRFATQGLQPHLTLCFDLAEGEGLKRASRGKTPDRMESSGAAFHARVRRGFLALARRDPRRVKLLKVSGRPPAEIFQESLGYAAAALKRAHHGI